MAVVEYERQGHIAIITMNRPERLNALGYDMMLGLAQTWTRFQEDEEAWVGILTAHPHRRRLLPSASTATYEKADGG